MKLFVMLLFLVSTYIHGQSQNIAQFAIWKPKDGQNLNFENGYKQHLLWHKNNKDPWNWYGWYIISGERYGQFVDATFNRAWKDFDQAIDPVGDRDDNNLHVFPFGDVQTIYKASYIPSLSMGDMAGLKSKFLRMVTLKLSNIDEGKRIIGKYRQSLQNKGGVILLTFKMIEGGDINQLILLIGFNSFEEYGETENLQEDISAIENELKIRTIISLASETLRYREDMSLFAK